MIDFWGEVLFVPLFVLPMVLLHLSWFPAYIPQLLLPIPSYRYGWKAAMPCDRVDEHLQVWRFLKWGYAQSIYLKGRSPNHLKATPWLSIETAMVNWFGGSHMTSEPAQNQTPHKPWSAAWGQMWWGPLCPASRWMTLGLAAVGQQQMEQWPKSVSSFCWLVIMSL